MTDFVTQRDGIRIAWSRSGQADGPTLMLLNSIGMDRSLWSAMTDRLANAGLDLVQIDTRGHGRSDAPDDDYRLSELASDVIAVMDEAGIARANIAGVSLGGMMAMQLAIDAPTRIERLMLICTSAALDPVAWNERVATVRGKGMKAIAPFVMKRFLSPQFASTHPERAEAVERNLAQMVAAGYAGCAAAIRDMSIAQRLGEISAPALVVTGTRDISTPLEGHGDRLLRALPGAVDVRLDCGHLAPIEVPDALGDAMLGFLADNP